MRALIFVVHDEVELLDRVVPTLRQAGYNVAAFSDPLAALNALEKAGSVELLISRVRFDAGMPHGINLALVARTKRPGLKVLFTALPEYEALTQGIGAFVPLPSSMSELVEAAGKLLSTNRLA